VIVDEVTETLLALYHNRRAAERAAERLNHVNQPRACNRRGRSVAVMRFRVAAYEIPTRAVAQAFATARLWSVTTDITIGGDWQRRDGQYARYSPRFYCQHPDTAASPPLGAAALSNAP